MDMNDRRHEMKATKGEEVRFRHRRVQEVLDESVDTVQVVEAFVIDAMEELALLMKSNAYTAADIAEACGMTELRLKRILGGGTL